MMSRSSHLQPQYPQRTGPASPVFEHCEPCPPTPRCLDPQCSCLKSPVPTNREPQTAFVGSPSESTSFADLPADHHPYDDPECKDLVDWSVDPRATYVSWPNPVLMVIQRAILDQNGFPQLPVVPSTCIDPGTLFLYPGGHLPKTGIDVIDERSAEYYAKRGLRPSLFRDPDCCFAYRYPISCIEAVQHSLRTDWSSVYPSAIPALIVRSRDTMVPLTLRPAVDGVADVRSTENSTWRMICQRGVDSTFRPINPSVTVETDICRMGAACHSPPHIVASQLAVNVFSEVVDSATGTSTHCEYLGAYVLQVVRGTMANRAAWMQRMLDLRLSLLRLFTDQTWVEWAIHRVFCLLLTPRVQFCFYKWDTHMVGLADEILTRN